MATSRMLPVFQSQSVECARSGFYAFSRPLLSRFSTSGSVHVGEVRHRGRLGELGRDGHMVWKRSRIAKGCGVGGGLRSGVRIVKVQKDVGSEEQEQEHELEQEQESLFFRIGVSIVTEILRLFSRSEGSQSAAGVEVVEPCATIGNQNVIEALRHDYEQAYFLTGDFTTTLYIDNCLFADPTIQFRGRDKYQRNLKLLVPFFEDPTLTLYSIEEDLQCKERSINATWNLRTYIRLPWKPLVNVDGSTRYIMNTESKIVKHIESWNISGRQAIQQLFVPSDRAFFRRS